MEQVLPGVYHWRGVDERLRLPVHSYYVEAAGALIDPITPEEGLIAFDGLARPQQAILTNHRHFRDSDRFAEAFGTLIRVAESGVAELDGRGGEVEPFWDGDEVAFGITAIEIDRIGRDETALHIAHGDGAIAFGDGLIHPPAAPIGFPADDMLGRHPDRARRGLKDAFSGLLLRDFDALLFAHGAPVLNRGKHALRRFVEEPTEQPGFGPYGTEP
jgi:hypothetical protein